MDGPMAIFISDQRPSNYDELTSTARAIVDDHIRAGVTPPQFAPAKPQVITHTWNSPIDDD